ncbi:uncharacterized protein EV420DRAFT_1589940, partial [Desarmillaria tabescens]
AWNEPTIMPAAALPPVETINGLNENGIIVKVIHSCAQDHAKLSQLGQTFLNYFIRPFKKFKGRTPAPSDHPSRPSFDVLKRDLRSKIREAPNPHTEAKDLALVRDGFRCVVTGSYDHNTAPCYTRCAHIVPESTYFNVSDQGPSNTKLDYAASVLAVLKRFGYDIEQTNGTKVHSLYNVMTMEVPTAITGGGNIHHPRSRESARPSETLLSLHAACAKVAHLSGAAEYIDKLDRDVEDLSVLAYNGSSGEVLRNALLNHMNQVVGVGA